MKKYIILESWHNGTNNGENEPYAICNNENDAKEILLALRSEFEIHGLGDGFPPAEDYRLMSESHDNIYSFWLVNHIAKENWNGPMSSEYRRVFKIVEENSQPDNTENRLNWERTFVECHDDETNNRIKTAAQALLNLYADSAGLILFDQYDEQEDEVELYEIRISPDTDTALRYNLHSGKFEPLFQDDIYDIIIVGMAEEIITSGGYEIK